MMALSRSLTTLRGTFCTVRESLKELAHCRDRVIDAGDHSWHCHEHRISYRTWRHSAPRATDSVARAVAGGAQQEQGERQGVLSDIEDRPAAIKNMPGCHVDPNLVMYSLATNRARAVAQAEATTRHCHEMGVA